MSIVRIYSQREPDGDYAVADYETQTRQLTYVSVPDHYANLLHPIAVGDTVPQAGTEEPWEAPGTIAATDPQTGQTLWTAGPFDALWDLPAPGQKPRPGYGPTRSREELAIRGAAGLMSGLSRIFGP